MHSLVGVLMVVSVLSSCAVADASGPMTQLANPAATYCIETGGEYEITKAADGSEAGVCTLPDGTKVDAWEYFRAQKS